MRRIAVAVGLVALIGASAILVQASMRSQTPPTGPGETHVSGSPDPYAQPVGDAFPANAPIGVKECKGVRISPLESIQQNVDRNPRGTTFCLTKGIHRLTEPLIPKSNQKLVGERGAILSGARRLRSFDRKGSFWTAGGQTQESEAVGICSPSSYTGCQHAEQVFIDNESLGQVVSLSGLSQGRFFFDYDANRIYLADDPSGHRVETSVVPQVFESSAATGIVIRGLVIEKFANPAQMAALQLGHSWLAIGNEVRLNHGVGIEADSDSVVRRNYVHSQGQLGLSGYGSTGALIVANEIAFNNTAGFDGNWEAGGGKWVRTTDLTVKDNYVHDNDGPGLWTDTDNIGTLYQGNHIVRNSGVGIFHEVSYEAVIRDNFVAGNATINDWLDGAGILIANSSDVEIYDNRLYENGDGIALKQSDRGSGVHGPYVVANTFVHDNIIAMCTGWTGAGHTDASSESIYDANNRFEDNLYQLDAGSAERWFWNDREMGRFEWLDLGHDTSGEFQVTDSC